MSKFSEYIQRIKSDIETGAYVGDGGFLVPENIDINKPGMRAWYWRYVGRLFHRVDWYKKGEMTVNFYDELIRIKQDLERDE
jgi:hypothetical protein